METTSKSTANEQQGGKKRIVWLDDAKMFAMLCVIFYHCLKYMPADMAGCSDTIEVITSFNMHLFVVLAGFTSFRALQRIACWDDYRRYVVKIALHLLVPTFAIGLLRALLTLDPHAIGNEQWFLKFLFRCLLMFATSCWLVAIASRRLDKTGSTRINQEYVEIAKYIGFLLLMFCTSKTKLPEFASYFLFGYLVKKYDLTGMLFRMKSNPRQFNIMLTAISLAGILTVACTFGISHSFDFYDYPLGRLSNDGMLSVFFARQICGFGWVLFFMPLFFLLSRRYHHVQLLGQQESRTLHHPHLSAPHLHRATPIQVLFGLHRLDRGLHAYNGAHHDVDDYNPPLRAEQVHEFPFSWQCD